MCIRDRIHRIRLLYIRHVLENTDDKGMDPQAEIALYKILDVYKRQAQVRVKKEISDEYDKKREDDIKNRKEVFTPEDIQKFYYAYKNKMCIRDRNRRSGACRCQGA